MKAKQISAKQFAILTFLIITAQKMFMLPALLIKTGGRDSYFSVLIFVFVEITVLLLIMLSIKMHPNKSLYTLLDQSATKIGGRIIAAVMLVYLFVKMTLLISELRVFFNITLSESLTEWLALIPLCVLLFLMGVKTLRGIGRLGEISIFLIVIAMAFLVLLTVGNLDLHWLKPVLENGFKPVLKNVWLYPMWYGDLSITVIFLGEVKQGKHFIKGGVIAAVLGSAIVTFFSLALFAAYSDMPGLLDYGNNISNMLLYSSSAYIHGRFDIPIFCIWVFSVFIQLGLVFYSVTRHASYIFSVKNNKIISGILAGLTYALFVFVFKNEYRLFNISTSFMRYFAAFNIAAVPLFVFFAALRLNKKRKNQRLIYSLKLNPAFKNAKRKKEGISK